MRWDITADAMGLHGELPGFRERPIVYLDGSSLWEASMLTIETVATVDQPGTMTVRIPASVAAGEHRVVVVIEEVPRARSSGRPFPDLAAFRADLGAVFHEGNTIAEMREHERG
jgi:hypothetical protein